MRTTNLRPPSSTTKLVLVMPPVSGWARPAPTSRRARRPCGRDLASVVQTSFLSQPRRHARRLTETVFNPAGSEHRKRRDGRAKGSPLASDRRQSYHRWQYRTELCLSFRARLPYHCLSRAADLGRSRPGLVVRRSPILLPVIRSTSCRRSRRNPPMSASSSRRCSPTSLKAIRASFPKPKPWTSTQRERVAAAGSAMSRWSCSALIRTTADRSILRGYRQ